MKQWLMTLGLLGALLGNNVLACSNHPGMTHAEWTSKVESQKEKNGSEKVMSDGFFGTVGKDAKESPKSGGEWRGPRRVNNQ